MDREGARMWLSTLIGRLRAWLGLAVISVASVACIPNASSGLIGEYVAAYGSARVLLVLQVDGRFTQTIEAGSAREAVSTGTWTYSAPDRRVTLTNLRIIASKDCGATSECKFGEPGIASLPVEREFGIGAVRLGVEFDHPYVRRAG